MASSYEDPDSYYSESCQKFFRKLDEPDRNWLHAAKHLTVVANSRVRSARLQFLYDEAPDAITVDALKNRGFVPVEAAGQRLWFCCAELEIYVRLYMDVENCKTFRELMDSLDEAAPDKPSSIEGGSFVQPDGTPAPKGVITGEFRHPLLGAPVHFISAPFTERARAPTPTKRTRFATGDSSDDDVQDVTHLAGSGRKKKKKAAASVAEFGTDFAAFGADFAEFATWKARKVAAEADAGTESDYEPETPVKNGGRKHEDPNAVRKLMSEEGLRALVVEAIQLNPTNGADPLRSHIVKLTELTANLVNAVGGNTDSTTGITNKVWREHGKHHSYFVSHAQRLKRNQMFDKMAAAKIDWNKVGRAHPLESVVDNTRGRS